MKNNKRSSDGSLQIGTGCEILQTPKGIYIDGVQQNGVKEIKIKKNSRQWTEVQITYLAHTFKKERD